MFLKTCLETAIISAHMFDTKRRNICIYNLHEASGLRYDQWYFFIYDNFMLFLFICVLVSLDSFE